MIFYSKREANLTGIWNIVLILLQQPENSKKGLAGGL